jgi:peptide-methionine (S)-S-oxide reductase
VKQPTSQKIMLGAGCLWGVQSYFDQIPGVVETAVGYTGGTKENPTYEDVCSHTTGHAEVVLVEFDEEKVSLETLLKHFFKIHDPTQLNRQGPDIGDQYRSAIFCYSEDQINVAKSLIDSLQHKYEQPIVTQVAVAQEFYRAEDYHQKYSEKTGRGACHIDYAPL